MYFRPSKNILVSYHQFLNILWSRFIVPIKKFILPYWVSEKEGRNKNIFGWPHINILGSSSVIDWKKWVDTCIYYFRYAYSTREMTSSNRHDFLCFVFVHMGRGVLINAGLLNQELNGSVGMKSLNLNEAVHTTTCLLCTLHCIHMKTPLPK